MSFNIVHNAKREGKIETYHLRVYLDKSASFSITEVETLMCSRTLDPNEDGSDVALDTETMHWLRVELKRGRDRAAALTP